MIGERTLGSSPAILSAATEAVAMRLCHPPPLAEIDFSYSYLSKPRRRFAKLAHTLPSISQTIKRGRIGSCFRAQFTTTPLNDGAAIQPQPSYVRIRALTKVSCMAIKSASALHGDLFLAKAGSIKERSFRHPGWILPILLGRRLTQHRHKPGADQRRSTKANQGRKGNEIPHPPPSH